MVESRVAPAIPLALEIVVNINNIIVITPPPVNRLPVGQRDCVRRLGIGLAMLSRLMLQFRLSWSIGQVASLVCRVQTGVFSVETVTRHVPCQTCRYAVAACSDKLTGLYYLAKEDQGLVESLALPARHHHIWILTYPGLR